MTIFLILFGLLHAILSMMNPIIELITENKEIQKLFPKINLKITFACTLAARGIIDLLLSLSFLAIAYSFGIKRIEFQSVIIKQSQKKTLKSGEDLRQNQLMSTINIIELFNNKERIESLALTFKDGSEQHNQAAENS